ncbi:MAG: HspR [Dehalococcoidia bacterium]|nr:HspR [Dehalococcoidia bacterium]
MGGRSRLYSEEDITRLRLIKHLVDELGLNLSGVELALDLTAKLLQLRSKLEPANGRRLDAADLIADVDDMLLKLGFKVESRG